MNLPNRLIGQRLTRRNESRRRERSIQVEALESRVLMSAVHATPVVPTVPVSLAAIPVSPTAVYLHWADADRLATGFVVFRSTNNVHFSPIATVTSPTALSYVDMTAAPSHTYTYKVEEEKGAVESKASKPASTTTPLNTPMELTASVIGPTRVRLDWTANEPSATGYVVFRATNGTSFVALAKVGKATSYLDTTVASGTKYAYEVQAINGHAASAASEAAAITTPTTPTPTTPTPTPTPAPSPAPPSSPKPSPTPTPAPPTTLAAPSGLSATVESPASINLTWTDNDPAALGYYVLRSADSGPFTQIANLASGTAASYGDTTISAGHAYAYEVQAYRNAIASAATAPAAVTIALQAPSALAATANSVTTVTPSATAYSTTTVTLTWTDNDPNATAYSILRSTDGTHYAAVGQVAGGAVATYADTTAASGRSYTYEVQAVNGTVVSPPSSPAGVVAPLAAPAMVVAIANSGMPVELHWTDMDPLATGYVILRSTSGQPFTPIARVSGSRTDNYVDSSVNTGTHYSYEVRATNATNQSAASQPFGVTTYLNFPMYLTPIAYGGTVQLDWTDPDPGAAGYRIFRSSGGSAFAQIAVSPGAADYYYDTTVLTGHAYSYEVEAFNGAATSGVSLPASVPVPLAAPSNLAAASTAAGIALNWVDNDPNALGYVVLRCTDGTHFTTLASLTSATAATYTDTSVLSGTTYTYEVEAVAGTIDSPVSNTAVFTAPLATPPTLTASFSNGSATLAWVDNDPNVIGYTVLRSTDSVTWTQLASLSNTAGSYVDASLAAGTTYFYQVRAVKAGVTAASNSAMVSVPGIVSVSPRYGDELVVTLSGTADSVSITEIGSTLTIIGDGQTFTDAAPAAGLFVYTRGGTDSVTIGQSVSTRTTIDSIDNAPTVINTAGSNVSIWDDPTDTVIGSATVHTVASFAGGVSKAPGASMPNPSDAGYSTAVNRSLFGTGPVAADANQGGIGDCYFLSTLAAFANQDPQVIYNSAVDLGDGTCAVEFHSSAGTPVYVRVSNSLPAGGFDGLCYAHPGANDTIWAAVMEKAFCYFRTGANTYNSIISGNMAEVYTDLNVGSTAINPASYSDAALYTMFSQDLSRSEPITMGTDNAPSLVSDHAYTLMGIEQVNGVNMYIVRNPWGIQGDSLENSAGIATLTYSQFVDNFVECVIAAPA